MNDSAIPQSWQSERPSVCGEDNSIELSALGKTAIVISDDGVEQESFARLKREDSAHFDTPPNIDVNDGNCLVRCWLSVFSRCELAFGNPAKESEFLLKYVRKRRAVKANVAAIFFCIIVQAIGWMFKRESFSVTGDAGNMQGSCIVGSPGQDIGQDSYTDFGCFDMTNIVTMVAALGFIALCTVDILREGKGPFWLTFWCVLLFEMTELVGIVFEVGVWQNRNATALFDTYFQAFFGREDACQLDVLPGGNFSICSGSINLCNLTYWAEGLGTVEGVSLVTTLTAMWFQTLVVVVLPLPMRSVMLLQIIPFALMVWYMVELLLPESLLNCGNVLYSFFTNQSCALAMNQAVESTLIIPCFVGCLVIPIVTLFQTLSNEVVARRLFVVIKQLKAKGSEIREENDPFAFSTLSRWVRKQEVQKSTRRAKAVSSAAIDLGNCSGNGGDPGADIVSPDNIMVALEGVQSNTVEPELNSEENETTQKWQLRDDCLTLVRKVASGAAGQVRPADLVVACRLNDC